MFQNTNNLAAYCWSIADLLRGEFKQSQYGRIILPFTLLRRLECVLEESKEAVLAEYKNVQKMNVPEEAQEKLLLRATSGLLFFNTSKMDLSKLGESSIKDNLESYIQSFSKDAREIFEHFKFSEFIGQLNDANLLYKIVQKVRTTDLSPKAVSNHDMGLVFEELIRRFAEGSNETAGEHFTPRDIVRLTTSLVFLEDDVALTGEGIIRTMYDPTAGTGGFLSSSMEYVHKLNSQAVIKSFGQELNPESYAICKADMLIKGQDVSNIKLGNTLSNDQLDANKFDYMLSNPPFGLDWKKIEKDIKDEHTVKGFDGRFGPGLPRVSDGSLLFLMHLVSKLPNVSEGGGRIGIIVNRSPLYTGGAGSGESEVRRYLVENDLLEAIVALPDRMHYNTGIGTYILILSNRKNQIRKNKVQIIDARNLGMHMRKRIGSKSQYFDDESIGRLLEIYADLRTAGQSRVVNNSEFGYRKVKLDLGEGNFEYEKVPLGEDIKTYLEVALKDLYPNYKIDELQIDHRDGLVGIVGYEFVINDKNIAKPGNQFRFYFENVASDEEWSFSFSKRDRKVVFFEEAFKYKLNKENYYFFRIKNHKRLQLDYLKYFLKSQKWNEWLETNSTNVSSFYLNKYDLQRMYIYFPEIEEQRHIVDILDDINNWQEKLIQIEKDVWSKDTGPYWLDKYKLPVDRELQERIIDISPFPIANIIHHYQNINQQDYKARYELLLKLFESLSVFLTSVLVGNIIDKNEESCQMLFNKQKGYLKNASFGTWHKLLEVIHEKFNSEEIDSGETIVEKTLNDNLLGLFKQAVDLRNDTLGHGGYPTKARARNILQKVEELNDEFMEAFYGMFEFYILVRPISGTWDGKSYTYQAEEFKGLGCYPFGLKEINAESPFVDGELYLFSEQSNEKIKLFPFIQLIDIDVDSSLEAFYFYSKMRNDLENEQKDSAHEFLYISHQQVNRQNQICTNEQISRIFE